MVEHLRGEIDFFILTRDTDYCETEPYSSVISDQWTKFKDGVSVFYFSRKFLSVGNLKKVALEANCEQWNINGIYSFYFSILPLFLGRNQSKIRLLVSSRGMLSPHALAVKTLKKKLLLNFFKGFGFYDNVDFHATNQSEAYQIEKQIGKGKTILIAPNLPKPAPTVNPGYKKKKTQLLKLISLARVSAEKNTLGALEILTKVESEVCLDWYGQVYDQSYMIQCEEIKNQLPDNVEVNFHDSISPDKIPSVLEQFHLLFSPTQGENFGHSIFESLMAGLPVIISDQTPWNNLEEKGIGWDISLEKPEQFVQAIEKAAAMSQSEYHKMSQASYDFAKLFAESPEVLEANRKLFDLT
jgi:glycosyltransferase involved in cell wall biosynthesis